MYQKVLSRGTGDVSAGIDYLLSETNHAGVEREHDPVILKGKPERLKQVCDNMTQKNKYASGLLAFEEVLDEEQKAEAIQSFEEHHFPGMDMNNVEILWVEHNDHDRTELNFIVAKVDLESGKALNPFPPGWQEYSDLWRDMFNEKHGYSRPDDLKNTQNLELDYESKQFCEEFQAKLASKNEIIEQVTKFIVEDNAKSCVLDSREDVLESLEKLEHLGINVERESDKFISISVPEHNKNIRLKGDFYDNNNYNESGYSLEDKGVSQRTDAERETEFRANCERINQLRESRAEYFAERFGASESIAHIDVEREVGAYRQNQLRHGSEVEYNAANKQRFEQSSEVVNEKADEIEQPQYEVDGGEYKNEQSTVPMDSDSRASQHISNNAVDSTSVELDQSNFIGIGHENESALTKANRFQRWFDEAKKQEKKLNRAMDNARQSIKRLKNETAKSIRSIAEDFFTFARGFIPSVGRVNSQSNQQNDDLIKLKQRANEFTNRTRKANEHYRSRNRDRERTGFSHDGIGQRYRKCVERCISKIGSIETKNQLLARENLTDEEFFDSLPIHQRKWFFDPAKEFAKVPELKDKPCPSCLKKACRCGAFKTNNSKKK